MNHLRRAATVFSLFALSLLATNVQAQAEDIFSNIGPDSDPFNYDVGTAILGGPATRGGDKGIQANFFYVPTLKDYQFDFLDIALSHYYGTNAITVSLRSDSGGNPGNVIESFSLTNALQPFGNEHPLLHVTSILKPMLQAGEKYWIYAENFGDAEAVWNWNTIGDSGRTKLNWNDEGWYQDGSPSGAFRVGSSAPIPEPAFYQMSVFSALGILGLLRLRRKSNH